MIFILMLKMVVRKCLERFLILLFVDEPFLWGFLHLGSEWMSRFIDQSLYLRLWWNNTDTRSVFQIVIDEQHEQIMKEESKRIKINQVNAKLQHQVNELNEVGSKVFIFITPNTPTIREYVAFGLPQGWRKRKNRFKIRHCLLL